jgi:hypothetical protein
MSDARTSAPWETIRFGLRILIGAWGAQIGLSIVGRLVWTLVLSAMKLSGGYGALTWVMGGVSFVLQMAHIAVGVTLVVAASRLTRFPLVVREPTLASPYRGARDGGPAPDPGIDGLAVALMVALATSAGLAVLSYVVTTVLSFFLRAQPGFGVREAVSLLAIAASLVAPVLFVIWSSRAARAVGSSLPLPLAITALAGLTLLAGFEVWYQLYHHISRAHAWSIWAMLGLNVLITGALIALARGLLEALRDQPREPGA